MNNPLTSRHQVHCMAGSMYRITRVSSNCPGWQIRMGSFGSEYYVSEYFPDKTHGGKAAALRAAQAVRDQKMRSRAYLQWKRASMLEKNSTGFFGVSCSARWQFVPSRSSYERKGGFWVRHDADGDKHIRHLAFITKGVWETYCEAVKYRYAAYGLRVSMKTLMMQYDQVFIPHWRDALAEIDMNWRRGI